MKPVKVWIIDEEWPEYEYETAVLKKELPGCEIRYSTYDNEKDLEEFGRYAEGDLRCPERRIVRTSCYRHYNADRRRDWNY